MIVVPLLRARHRHDSTRAHQDAERAVELVDLLLGPVDDTATIAAAVVATAAAYDGPDALVTAAVHVCDPDDAGLARLVVALTDLDGRSDADVADVAGRPVEEIVTLGTSARRELDVAAPRSQCRGWSLVRARHRVTDDERAVGDAHLNLCRSCRSGVEQLRTTRQRLLVRGAAVTATVVGDVVALTVPAGGAVAGAGGLLSVATGKAAVIGLGAAVAAVTATSASVAAARAHAPVGHQHAVPPSTSASTSAPSSSASAAPAQPRQAASSAPMVTPPASASIAPRIVTPDAAAVSPSAPVVVPTQLPTLLPLPTLTSLTPLPLPSASLPVPLPSLP